MSKITKAVLYFIIAVALLLITLPISAKGSAKFGLTQINSDSTTLKASVDQSWEFDIVDLVTELDYVYKEQDDIVKMDKFSTIGKVNKDLTEKYYTFGSMHPSDISRRLKSGRSIRVNPKPGKIIGRIRKLNCTILLVKTILYSIASCFRSY